MRFKEFSGKWEEKQITEIAFDEKSAVKIGPFGSQLKKEYLIEEGPYKVYGQENVFKNDFSQGNRFINEDRYLVLKSSELVAGDIVISMMGTIGKISEVPNGIQKGIMDSHLIRIRLDNTKYLNEFFTQVMNSRNVKKQIMSLSVGSIMSGLSSKIIKSLIFPMTSVDEQEKISTFLISLDKKIQLQQEKIDLLQEQKKGYMQKIFKREIRFKDDDGKDYPKWHINVRMETLFKSISNKKNNGDEPVLSATQDRGMVYRDTLERHMAFAKENLKSYKLVEVGDFVISLRSFQGGIEYSQLQGLVSPAYTVFRKVSEDVDEEFFAELFKTTTFIQRLNSTTYGIRDGKAISYSDFSTLRFDLPCIEEQRKIAKFISILDKKIDIEQQKLEALQQQKKGFMQQMFI
ncbi:restriction endonuclease subunit S [Bacillus cereus]|uniref:restriction endonuclease subunit S n=1 Tax=Bacillus cereus TaxID=1396 RepID=UPI0009B58E14|nr:restriction endonuclease subunit S [Bacillus cereus]MDN4100460.1 restriction endonuclease subunit S [Bacillus cereus]